MLNSFAAKSHHRTTFENVKVVSTVRQKTARHFTQMTLKHPGKYIM
jgi:hypothetical protein